MEPANSIAETIVRLKEENLLYAEHIERHSLLIESNNQAIEQLEPMAEWTESPQEELASNNLEIEV
jgi:hypothetical protein